MIHLRACDAAPGTVGRFWLLLFALGCVMLAPPPGLANAPVQQPPSIDPTRPQQSLYAVQQFAAYHGWTTTLHLDAGDLHHVMGETHAAVIHWEAAASDDWLHQRQLAEAYLELGRWNDAITQLERISQQRRDDIWTHYELGLLRAVRDPLRALDHLALALADPRYATVAQEIYTTLNANLRDPLLAFRVGISFFDLELWAHAEYAFSYSSTVSTGGSPAQAEALAYLAYVRHRQGKSADALFERAGQTRTAPRVAYLHGLYLRETGEPEAANSQFVLAIRLDPANPAYYAELGLTYQQMGLYDDAHHWLQTAADIADGAGEFGQLLAVFYAEEGYRLPELSPRDLYSAAADLPPDPGLVAGIGWTLHLAGDSSGGLAYVAQALGMAPSDPTALYTQARILLDTGDAAGARAALVRLSQQDSVYSEWAGQALAALAAPDATPGS